MASFLYNFHQISLLIQNSIPKWMLRCKIYSNSSSSIRILRKRNNPKLCKILSSLKAMLKQKLSMLISSKEMISHNQRQLVSNLLMRSSNFLISILKRKVMLGTLIWFSKCLSNGLLILIALCKFWIKESISTEKASLEILGKIKDNKPRRNQRRRTMMIQMTVISKEITLEKERQKETLQETMIWARITKAIEDTIKEASENNEWIDLKQLKTK